MDILHPPDILRGQSFFLHQMAVVGHIVPHMANLLHNLFILDLQDLLPGRRFDLRLVVSFHIIASFCSFDQVPGRKGFQKKSTAFSISKGGGSNAGFSPLNPSLSC